MNTTGRVARSLPSCASSSARRSTPAANPIPGPPAPARELALRAKAGSGDRLVSGPRVVVQAAGELRIDDERDPEPLQHLLHPGEVDLAGLAEELLHLRRGRRDLLAFRVLAVEDADGIGLDPLLAILAQLRRPRTQVGLQGLAILRPAARVSERVEAHLERDAQDAQPAVEQLHLLSIDARPRA